MASYGPEYRRRWNEHNRLRRLAIAPPDDVAAEYALILRDDPCSYCGSLMEHVDHIVPIARGGNGGWDNLTAACAPCNLRKQARPLLLFLLTRVSFLSSGPPVQPLPSPPREGAADAVTAMEVGTLPKELVYSANPESDVVEHVAVGWTKDRDVQLGVWAGKQVTLTIDGQPSDPSLWMDMDRTQINRLIRALRRARDSAYGLDA